MATSRKRIISTLLKSGVSVLLLYLVFSKIAFNEVWSTVKQVRVPFLLLGMVLFFLSQWVSAKRLLLFLEHKKFYLSEKSNNILYLIGMFYNFFIPGGIGGDAYKVYVLNRKFGWGVKDLTAVVFIDRFMGLAAIGSLIVLLSYRILQNFGLVWVMPLAMVSGLGVAYFFVYKVFPSFKEVFFKTLGVSVVVQLLQVLVIVVILYSLESGTNLSEYILVFLISSVLSIFSFSGIGVREFVFYQASQILSIDPSTAVTIGLLFSVITALISMPGILYHFRAPQLTLSKTE